MNQENDQPAAEAGPGNPVTFELVMHEGLLDRIRVFCDKHDLDLNEFIVDAVTEKMALQYRERRKKKRL